MLSMGASVWVAIGYEWISGADLPCEDAHPPRGRMFTFHENGAHRTFTFHWEFAICTNTTNPAVLSDIIGPWMVGLLRAWCHTLDDPSDALCDISKCFVSVRPSSHGP